jgi:hypothetical protein
MSSAEQWCVAVWKEKKTEYQEALPDSWVNTSEQLVYWPRGKPIPQSDRHLHKPDKTWRKFPLLEVVTRGKNVLHYNQKVMRHE